MLISPLLGIDHGANAATNFKQCFANPKGKGIQCAVTDGWRSW